MILNVMTLFAGVILTAAACVVYYSDKIRTIKEDAKVELDAQATDSYRAGYMRGYGDKTIARKNQDVRNVYASITR